MKRLLLFLIAAAVLVSIFLYWTRFQTVGQMGSNSVHGPVVINRFNGKVWVVSPFGVKEIPWKIEKAPAD
jgi:hypothetical protein